MFPEYFDPWVPEFFPNDPGIRRIDGFGKTFMQTVPSVPTFDHQLHGAFWIRNEYRFMIGTGDPFQGGIRGSILSKQTVESMRK